MVDTKQALANQVHRGISSVENAVERVKQRINDRVALSELRALAVGNRLSRKDTLDALEHPFPRYGLPPRRDRYIGRAIEATDASKYFNDFSGPNSTAYLCLYGIGGVGKSSFALNYAWKSQQKGYYDAIFWINSETMLTMKESFTSMALRLDSTTHSDNHDADMIMVTRWLEQTSESSFSLI